MGFMGLYPQIWTKLGVIIPVYVVRTAIINSAYPLQKSILMDYVPKVSYSCNVCEGTGMSSCPVTEVAPGTFLCCLLPLVDRAS